MSYLCVSGLVQSGGLNSSALPKITHSRLVDYIASGGAFSGYISGYYQFSGLGPAHDEPIRQLTPVVGIIPQELCIGDEGLFGARHIDGVPPPPNFITKDGEPVNPCCDAVRSGAYEEECWPFGGITYDWRMEAVNVENCLSANDQRWFLEWNGVDGWEGGTLGMRGGSLDFKISCISGAAFNSPAKFKLEYQGCASGEVVTGYQCLNPIVLNFGNIGGMEECCSCENTDQPANINLFAYANCKPVVYGRHIDYRVKNEKLLPIIAMTNDCGRDHPGLGCELTCGITAEITSVTGTCDCLEGVYPMPYDSGQWENLSVPCTDPGILRLICLVNVDEEGKPDGTITLRANYSCGVVTTGQGEVVISAECLEDLDATIEMEISSPVTPCTPNGCLYEYIAMVGLWSLIADNCVDSCGPCPENPGFSAGFDGEQRSTDCPGDPAGECCVGTVKIRFLR